MKVYKNTIQQWSLVNNTSFARKHITTTDFQEHRYASHNELLGLRKQLYFVSWTGPKPVNRIIRSYVDINWCRWMQDESQKNVGLWGGAVPHGGRPTANYIRCVLLLFWFMWIFVFSKQTKPRRKTFFLQTHQVIWTLTCENPFRDACSAVLCVSYVEHHIHYDWVSLSLPRMHHSQ